MNKRPHKSDEDNANGNFIGPDGRTYVFNRRSRIYEPKPQGPECESEGKKRITQSFRLHRVEVRRDWLVFGITTLISIATFLIVAIYTFYAQKQADISEAANYNFMKANRDNGRTVTLTLDKMKGEITQMGRLADEMRDQAIQTKKIAGQAIVQAVSAKSAADTAKEALHTSERAYVIIQDPVFDFPTKSIKLPLSNSGRIPSGKMLAITHQVTINVAKFGDIAFFRSANDKSWQHSDWESIVPGSHQIIAVPLPELDADKINAGLQSVIVAGTLSYNDGFVGTPQQTWRFCFKNVYQTTMKQSFIVYCNPNEILPKLEANDGYPNNEHKD